MLAKLWASLMLFMVTVDIVLAVISGHLWWLILAALCAISGCMVLLPKDKR